MPRGIGPHEHDGRLNVQEDESRCSLQRKDINENQGISMITADCLRKRIEPPVAEAEEWCSVRTVGVKEGDRLANFFAIKRIANRTAAVMYLYLTLSRHVSGRAASP